ncbi:TPA: hypothetical protein DCF80_01840 [Candidatus Saccharibacteria bacterium]|nr:hypothetical protein [Candidatus Saccharibacteria bacterium]
MTTSLSRGISTETFFRLCSRAPVTRITSDITRPLYAHLCLPVTTRGILKVVQRIKTTWKRLPDKPRRILTFILGALLIVTAGLIGWVPGPGGTIIFLLGIAVLATEFSWAERVRDFILKLLKDIAVLIRRYPLWSLLLLSAGFLIALYVAYLFYTYII